MRMPLGVRIDRAIRISESVSSELVAHLADHNTAVFALMRAVVNDLGTSKSHVANVVSPA